MDRGVLVGTVDGVLVGLGEMVGFSETSMPLVEAASSLLLEVLASLKFKPRPKPTARAVTSKAAPSHNSKSLQ
jgi:hypothetical protein